MHELLTQQLKKSFGEAFKHNALSPELQDFITQVEASYSELSRKNILLDNTLNNIYSELNESNKKIIERNHDLFELLERRSSDLEVKREEAEKAINLLTQYREAIDNTLIVTMTDPKGIITYVNDNFCNISGYSLEEVVNHSHNIIRHPDTNPSLYKKLWQQLQNKKIWKSTMHNRKKDGSSYHVSVNIIPILDVDGSVLNYISIQEDITARVLTQQKLKAEQERASILFNHQESSVVISNKRRGLIEANQSFYAHFGFKNIRQFKKHFFCISDLFQEEEGCLKPGSSEHYWAESVLKSPDRLHRVRMIDINGNINTYSVYSRYIELDGERSVLSTFSDISESERLRVKAEAAEQAKSEFLANMSHEIRTPLNSIYGFLQLLDETEIDTKQKEYIDIAQDSMQTLLSVVNDVLDFSMIDSGKIEIELVEQNIHSLFTSLHASFMPLAQHKNIAYSLTIDNKIERHVQIDDQHIRQIMQNLINNALKFTPEYGSVSIELALLKKGSRSQRIRISVKDTGIGIPENKLESIMRPFSQADSSTTRKFGGSGLGLSISNALIGLQGGELQIISEEGKGSLFSFEIDLLRSPFSSQETPRTDRAEETSVTMVSQTTSDADSKPFSVLIAEDYEVNRMFIGMLLSRYSNLKYDFAINGQEVLSMLEEKPYDMILMDINMPVLNGIDTTIHIRQELRLEIPIIAVTANALKGDRQRFLEIGMNDYLSKPLEITEMDKIILAYRP